MTHPEARQTKADFEEVRRILHGEWDPIGCGVPLDEYDSYCWPVLALLRRKALRSEVETYLRWAADEQMQSPVPAERLAFVLDRLMALDVG
ncbi:MAG: hypothetical protein QM773_12860 [Hyphomonadaceae bacterium]